MGYDFYTMDFRGHGKSEGEIGQVPSIDILGTDTINYHEKIIETFYSKNKK